ncbi:MAG: hypothetical protein ACFE7E_08635 [Candidatus Hodarchaeota archaeon]
MTRIDFEELEQNIIDRNWFRFGDKEFECPGIREEEIRFYLEKDKLPSPCDKCYKALIFWEAGYSEDNITDFLRMIDSFEDEFRGKLNKGVAVFYFRKKARMLRFLKHLKRKMNEFNVKGRIQWRRACRVYQALKPELWKNQKEFAPDT